jgi:hypothetical protein
MYSYYCFDTAIFLMGKGSLMENDKKTLEQMLIEFAGRPTSSNAARNYSVFMEHWEQIQEAHRKGWSYLMIWKTLTSEGIFTFSYPAFTSYIRKLENRQAGYVPGKRKARNESPQSSPAIERIGAEQQRNQSPNRVDMPVFGQNLPPRDPKKF